MTNFADLFKNVQSILFGGKSVVTPSFNVANSTQAVSKNIKSPFAASSLGIATNTVLGLPKAAYGNAKWLGDTLTNLPGSLIREGVGFAGDIRNAVVPKQKQVFEAPTPKYLGVIPGYGNEPTKTLAANTASMEQKLRDMGLNKSALPLAFGAVVGSAALDFTPFGGGKKVVTEAGKNIPFKFLKFVAETTDKKVLAKTFESIGVKDAGVIANLADKGAVAKTTDEVLQIFRNPDNFRPTANVASDVSLAKNAQAIVSKGKEAVTQSFDNVSGTSLNKSIAQNKGIVEGDPLATLRNAEKRVGVETTDIQGNKVEQIFARKATVLEQKSPSAKSRGYNSIPDKVGYEKVFKPYGENGAGYYYNKNITQTLAQEAQKYKTADEFVKAQTPLFRGGGYSPDKIGDLGVSVSFNKDSAARFPITLPKELRVMDKTGRFPDFAAENAIRQSNIKEFHLDPKAKILTRENIPERYISKDEHGAESFGSLIKELDYKNGKWDIWGGEKRLVAYAKENGYDAIDLSFAHEKSFNAEKELRIINPDVLKTKSQLTDFYNQANKPTRKVVNRAEYDPGYFDRKPVQLPPHLEQKAITLEIQKEAIANNPLNNLIKYASKSGENKGHLPEVLGGKGTSGFKKKGDDIVTEVLGKNVDSETARAQFDKFVEQKKVLMDSEVALKQDIKRYSSEGIPLALSKKQIAIQSEKRPVLVRPYVGSIGEVRSVEKVAEQFRGEVQGYSGVKIPSLSKVITQSTPIGKKVGMLDYIRTPENVLKKIGMEKEGKLIRQQYEKYVKELPKNIERITEWSKEVPKESNKRIFKYLDGQAIDLNPSELKVVGEIKVWLSEWADRLGLPHDKRIAEYITHLFDDQLIKKEFDEDLAKIIAEKIPGSVYDPFLLKRLGAKGYKQDTWAALDAYVKRATRKVHMDPALERLQEVGGGLEKSMWDYLKSYADRINIRPTEFDTKIDNSLKQSPLGYKLGQRPVATISKVLRQTTFRGMLGGNVGSALRNLSQGVNTYAKLGEKYTALGYIKLGTNGLQELRDVGVLADNFIQDRSLSATKKYIEKLDKGLFFFFDTAEKVNRGAAYYGAKAKALSKGMTEEAAVEYGKKIVRDTQFLYSSIDTPLAMSSDVTKIFTQFLTYPVKQTEFLLGMAKNREYMGIARYVLGGLAFVYTIGQVMGMQPSEIVPWYNYFTGQSKFGVPPSLKAPVAAIKALADAPDKYGNDRTVSQKLKDVGKESIGIIPAGIQGKKTIQGIQAIKSGGSYDAAGRLQFPVGQSPYAKAQAILFGKYVSPEAKDYFNRGEITKAEKAKVQPIYDEAQKLLAADDKEGATDLVNQLSETDYATYQKIKKSAQAAETMEGKKAILPRYNEIQKMSSTDQQAAVDAMTDAEYKAYTLVKKDQEKVKAAANGEKPTFDPNTTTSTNTVLDTVVAYAKALALDPQTAFNRIFTGQKIRYVANGTVVVERMSLASSQAEKEAQGSTGSEVKLDHTLPLQLGGGNDKANLKLVPTAVWSSYTPVEDALGKALRTKKINKSKAQQLIKDFKNGDITAEQVYNDIK